MARKFKLFSVMALAVLALTAVAASAAQAAEFHVESTPATIKGEQIGTQVFTTTAGTVECEVATFNGESKVLSTTTQELHPEYKNCSAFGGFLNATVSTTGCNYLFHITGSTSPYATTADVVCSGSSAITVTSAFCTVTVKPQTGLTGITMTNTGTKTTRDLDASINITNVVYDQTSGCTGGAWTNHTGGTLTGNATIRAYTSGGVQQGLFIS